MQSARVLGSARATVKHESLAGQRLLVVQPLQIDGSADGSPLLAIDPLGAGRGDTVIITSDSESLHLMLRNEKTPARWSVMGLLDVTVDRPRA